MLDHRLRRWPNITTTLGRCIVFVCMAWWPGVVHDRGVGACVNMDLVNEDVSIYRRRALQTLHIELRSTEQNARSMQWRLTLISKHKTAGSIMREDWQCEQQNCCLFSKCSEFLWLYRLPVTPKRVDSSVLWYSGWNFFIRIVGSIRDQEVASSAYDHQAPIQKKNTLNLYETNVQQSRLQHLWKDHKHEVQ